MTTGISLNSKKLEYTGPSFFRQRLVLSTLSTLPIIISDIRYGEEEPGIREYEAGVIWLLEKIMSGAAIEINETGTRIVYKPGILIGGPIEHVCNLDKSIGYYLEVLLMVAPFCKEPIKARFKGVTNCCDDPSVDYLKHTSLKLLDRAGISPGLDIKIISRGAKPLGGGEVLFTCPVIQKLKPLHWLDPGLVKKVRGIACTMRVAPTNANRMIDECRGVFNRFLPDVFIVSDHAKGKESGKSPGYGMCLVAETTSGTLLAANTFTSVGEGIHPDRPEDIGKNCSHLLLEEIFRGGCVDTRNQSLVLLLMAMASDGVSRVIMGYLTDYTIEFLRHLKDFFGVMFKVETKPDSTGGMHRQLVYLSCSGMGYWSIGRPTF
ncbi:RNA 3'-terminal phosphate cyclase-like protein [Oopsacas minuta]|uniref:RNA 3'-terminal phosphate cyclase-like protein n=1 Tax=Oopsacas minuta TaxID=111878 RepID=A0AAV7K6R6_9METZ|nr:RNA 3'-terminal phosphate cyclase-like protein [Oopsacas minuta]